jgi:hypothetical protein
MIKGTSIAFQIGVVNHIAHKCQLLVTWLQAISAYHQKNTYKQQTPRLIDIE